MNYIKIMSKGWDGFTGNLNVIRFENGISTEPVPQNVADKIAAAVSIMPCNADGSEVEGAEFLGIQHRLIAASAARAPVANELPRQTEDEKLIEQKIDAARGMNSAVDKIYSREELEEIADKEGIKGLRKIGEGWNVRGRAIPDLIKDILRAQNDFEAKRKAAIEKLDGKLRTHTLPYEPEEAEAPAAEEVLEPLGHPDLVENYMLGKRIITGASLVDLALRKSGKSLTGWNALTEEERHDAIFAQMEELEAQTGDRFDAIVPEKPAEDPVVEAGNQEEPEQLTPGEAEAVVELDDDGSASTETETPASE